jgi:hypothetical protein
MDAVFRPHRWTAADVQRMVEAGILAEDAPLELIDGALVTLSPQGSRHRMTTVRVRRRLEEAFGAGHYVQDHSPVAAGPDSLPEPDVAVVRGAERFDRHPGADEVVVVVEISETSQQQDQAKAAIYAGAGFAEYWNLDLPRRRLVRYLDPRAADREYATVHLLRDADTVEVAGSAIPVADLLPPPE